MHMNRLLFALMAALLCTTQVLAQIRTITGKVRDVDGSPVSNVSVVIKGSTIGTKSKLDGSFTIVVPINGAVVISSTGHIPQEFTVTADRTNFDVLLKKVPEVVFKEAEIPVSKGEIVSEEAEIVFEEVVVVPYATLKRETFPGSVGQIRRRHLDNRAITNITTVIEGLVPGVITTSTNGQPGSGPDIRIRGFGSINASARPLLVVDGVPYVADISNINPADVESMTVLKDAAATALYGSRAGNGVIMITTRKGRKGTNGISVKVMQGVVSRGLPEYDRVTASQYYPLMWEAYRNSLIYPISGPSISLDSANRVASGLTSRPGIQSLLSYNPFNVANNAIVGTDGQLNSGAQLLYGGDLDWTKELFRNGARSDYFVDFNGGSEKSDYFFSLGYVKENGYILKSDFKRYTARLNVNVQPKTWLKTGLNVSANHSLTNLAQDSGSTSLVNPFYFTRNIGPIYPVYAHNMTSGEFLLDSVTGQKFYDLGNMGGAFGVPNRTQGAFAGRHALGETRLNEELIRRTSVSARTYQEFTFLRNFRFTNNLSVDYQSQNNNSYDNPLVGDGAPIGRSQKESISNSAFVASQLLNYGNTSDVHTFNALVGHESFNQMITSVNGSKQGQTVSGNVGLGNFSTINSTGSYEDRYKIESYFSRLSYDYDDKYFVSASLRRDGNSIFSSKSRWGTFWSVGAGWNLSNENFIANIRWIDFLKLRGSYGLVGVADGNGTATSIGFYAYQGLYNYLNNANEPGIVQSQTQTLLSPNLTWEQNKQLNFGLDFNFFKSRISGSVDYFQRVSSDLLFAIPQPLSQAPRGLGVWTWLHLQRTIRWETSPIAQLPQRFRWPG